jgi:transcriptional regulator with XRE-family HTH domain
MENNKQGYQPEDPEVALGEALEHLQLVLSIQMRKLREREGLTQGELGERMGVNQSTVSKLENANVHSDLESLLRYLFALDADLVLGILDSDELIPVSAAAEVWCHR